MFQYCCYSGYYYRSTVMYNCVAFQRGRFLTYPGFNQNKIHTCLSRNIFRCHCASQQCDEGQCRHSKTYVYCHRVGLYSKILSLWSYRSCHHSTYHLDSLWHGFHDYSTTVYFYHMSFHCNSLRCYSHCTLCFHSRSRLHLFYHERHRNKVAWKDHTRQSEVAQSSNKQLECIRLSAIPNALTSNGFFCDLSFLLGAITIAFSELNFAIAFGITVWLKK